MEKGERRKQKGERRKTLIFRKYFFRQKKDGPVSETFLNLSLSHPLFLYLVSFENKPFSGEQDEFQFSVNFFSDGKLRSIHNSSAYVYNIIYILYTYIHKIIKYIMLYLYMYIYICKYIVLQRFDLLIIVATQHFLYQRKIEYIYI